MATCVAGRTAGLSTAAVKFISQLQGPDILERGNGKNRKNKQIRGKWGKIREKWGKPVATGGYHG